MNQTASDIMSKDVQTVSPETSVEDLARAFAEQEISGFPVVDSGGGLVGVITEADLLHQNERLHIPTTFVLLEAVISLGSSKRLEDEMRRMAAATVGELMTTPPITVREQAPVSEVAALFAEKHVHTLPVLDDEGNLVGVIGKLDVIRTMVR